MLLKPLTHIGDSILIVKGKLLKSKMRAAIVNEKGPFQIKSKEKHNKIKEHRS